MSDEIKKGLLGIVVDETTVSQVMPDINSLTYRGYAVQDLCEKCAFEGLGLLKPLMAFLKSLKIGERQTGWPNLKPAHLNQNESEPAQKNQRPLFHNQRNPFENSFGVKVLG